MLASQQLAIERSEKVAEKIEEGSKKIAVLVVFIFFSWENRCVLHANFGEKGRGAVGLAHQIHRGKEALKHRVGE